MNWRIDVDALERCPGGCGRLICDVPDCAVLRELMNGEFYVHPRTEEAEHPAAASTLSPGEWRRMIAGAAA